MWHEKIFIVSSKIGIFFWMLKWNIKSFLDFMRVWFLVNYVYQPGLISMIVIIIIHLFQFIGEMEMGVKTYIQPKIWTYDVGDEFPLSDCTITAVVSLN